MTHTDEDLLALANSAVDDLLYDAQNDCQFPDYMRIADWLQGPSTLADMRGWIVEATLRAIVAERQKPHTHVGGEASVAVCPICDIAGCHHIRDAERQAIRDKAMDDADDTERYGRTKVAKIRAAYNDLRSSIYAGDMDTALEALRRYEQWADYIFDERHKQ